MFSDRIQEQKNHILHWIFLLLVLEIRCDLHIISPKIDGSLPEISNLSKFCVKIHRLVTIWGTVFASFEPWNVMIEPEMWWIIGHERGTTASPARLAWFPQWIMAFLPPWNFKISGRRDSKNLPRLPLRWSHFPTPSKIHWVSFRDRRRRRLLNMGLQHGFLICTINWKNYNKRSKSPCFPNFPRQQKVWKSKHFRD